MKKLDEDSTEKNVVHVTREEMEKLRAIIWAKQIVIGALDRAYQELNDEIANRAKVGEKN